MRAGRHERILVALAVCAGPYAYADNYPLQHDPFARPALAALATGNAASSGEAPAPAWNPRLSSVMIAGKDSLVIVDGAIVRLSEEIDGYRLVQVRDREAVFQKGRQRIVLEMGATALKRGKDRGGR